MTDGELYPEEGLLMSTGTGDGSITHVPGFGLLSVFFLFKISKTTAVDHQSGSLLLNLESASIWLMAGVDFCSFCYSLITLTTLIIIVYFTTFSGQRGKCLTLCSNCFTVFQ